MGTREWSQSQPNGRTATDFPGLRGTSDFFRSSLQNVHPALKETGWTDCGQDRRPLAVAWRSRLRLEPWGAGGQVNGIGIWSTRRLPRQKHDALYLFTEGFPSPWMCQDLAHEHHGLVLCPVSSGCQERRATSPGRRADAEGEPRILGRANFSL